jgi:hypothetical protein
MGGRGAPCRIAVWIDHSEGLAGFVVGVCGDRVSAALQAFSRYGSGVAAGRCRT